MTFPTASLRALSLAGLALALTPGCASDDGAKSSGTSNLEIKLRRIEVAESSFEAMNLKVIAVVINGGSKDAQLTGGNASVALLGPADDGVEVADGVVDGARYSGTAPTGPLPANSETEVPIALQMPLPSDAAALEALLDWGTVKLDVDGALEFGGASESFAGAREVSVPVLPKVLLKEAQVASIDGGTGGSAFFTMGIENPNVFEAKVDTFAWGISIADKEMRPVDAGSVEMVPPSSVAEFEDTVTLNQETFGAEVTTLLKQPAIPYVVTGHFEVKGIRREFSFEGEMAFAR